MNVEDIKIADFDYPLPDGFIPRHPFAKRDGCRLLHTAADGRISDLHFYDLPEIIPSDAILVCNDTKVINARLHFTKETGSTIEIFLLEPHDPADYERAFTARGHVSWNALIGNFKRWKSNLRLTKKLTLSDGEEVILTASRGESTEGSSHIVTLSWIPEKIPFADIISAAGKIPIPPYLRRESEETDTTDYQTVYSQTKGSVAAPTAGLHFTSALLEELAKKGVEKVPLTLHVGAGTFQPVKSESIGEHPMHTESFCITLQSLRAIIKAKKDNRPVVAVGTTSVRTLESLPLIGHSITSGHTTGRVSQWEAYSSEMENIDTIEALTAIEKLMTDNGIDSFPAQTSIMIAPGFKWRIVTDLITNFHQPQSTLLLLVASFLGDETGKPDQMWRRIYDHALREQYRFLSYGDACFFSSSR